MSQLSISASSATNDRLSALLLSELNTEEQQLFVKSFRMYLEHGHDDKAFVVNYDDVWQWLGFTRKDTGKTLLIKSFTENVDYIIHKSTEKALQPKTEQKSTEKPLQSMEPDLNSSEFQETHVIQKSSEVLLLPAQNQNSSTENRGGKNKETILLTVDTFKDFCMRASTAKAKIVRGYYLKMEKILQKHMFECQIEAKALSDARIKTLEEEVDTFQSKLKTDARDVFNLTRHKDLIEMFRGPDMYVVYIALIAYKEEKQLIKIGCTKNIGIRVQQLEVDFGKIRFINVFPCTQNERFEKYLHHHKNIAQFAYREEIHQGHSSNETFLVNKDELDIILNIVKHNRHRFNDMNNAEHELESQRIALEHDKVRLELAKLSSQQKNQPQQTTVISNDINHIALTNIVLTKQLSTYKQSRGPKIQRYSPDGNQLLQTYIGHSDAIRDTSLNNASRAGLTEAINKNTVYKGFRWAILLRELDDSTIQELEPTVDQTEIRLGYIAMLDLDKSRIVQVFSDQKSAGANRKFNSGASISVAIRIKRPAGGHYFMFYEDCSQALKEDYLKNNVLPAPAVRVNGNSIDQLHPISNEIIKTYSSVAEVLKVMHISRQSMSKALEGTILKGYRWRLHMNTIVENPQPVESKLSEDATALSKAPEVQHTVPILQQISQPVEPKLSEDVTPLSKAPEVQHTVPILQQISQPAEPKLSEDVTPLSKALEVQNTVPILQQISQPVEPKLSEDVTPLSKAPEVQHTVPISQPAIVSDLPISNTRPIVQLYDPSDLTKVVHVIDGLMHATREIPGTNLRNIKEAAAHRTIYHNYRWFLLSRKKTTDPMLPQDIGATVLSRQKRTGLVAKLNIDQTVVLNVYTSQKEVSIEVNHHTSLVSNAVKYNTIMKNYYWACWDDLTEDMRNIYLAQNQLPKAATKSNAHEVQKINPETLQVVHTYSTLHEVYTNEGITTKAVKHSSDTNKPYKGFQWKIVKSIS